MPPDKVQDYGSYARLIPSFVFYGSYHAHPINQLIHVVFVPSIFITGLIFASYLDVGSFFPVEITKYPIQYVGALSLDLFVAFYYALTYIYLSPNVIGVSAAALVFLALLASQAFVAAVGPVAWIPALILHIVSWVAQVHWGHGIYEKRAPALLDNLYQALVTAPLFVFVESLMWLDLVPKLKRIVQPLIAKEISRYLNSRSSST